MRRLKLFIKRYFGEEAFEWFDRSYLVDWAAIAGLWILSQIIAWSSVYERSFDPLDPLISFSHKKNQVGSATNHFIALLVPLAVFIVVAFIRGSLHIIHHAFIGLWASRGLARLITQVLKHSVGRLRPDFLARCKWDSVTEVCMGTAKDIAEGRKSFPSGHSSTAFAGMVFLSLWMAGQTAAWCFASANVPGPIRSRMIIFNLTLLPIFWATHVAITRIQDHRHHKEDVIAGSFIGIASALICYLMFWPSPFASSSFEFAAYGQPRLLYVQDRYQPSRTTEFQLTEEGEV